MKDVDELDKELTKMVEIMLKQTQNPNSTPADITYAGQEFIIKVCSTKSTKITIGFCIFYRVTCDC